MQPNSNTNNKRKKVLHSIPIRFKSNVLSSIPSILALLLMGIVGLINSNTCSAAASVSLSIDGNNSSKTIKETLTPNVTKYVSSNVSYSANDTQSYTISINYANSSKGLKYDGDTSSTTSTTIAEVTTGNNTNGVLGSSINNAWGYAWTDSSTASDKYDTLSYHGISSSRNVDSGTGTSSTVTKQLIFAANLADSNPTGSYKAKVELSVTATPKIIGAVWQWSDNSGTVNDTDSGITTMQQMNSSVCSQVSTPTASNVAGQTKAPTLKLIDVRDNSEYTIAKLPDGKCWMTSNLHLAGNTNLANASGNELTPNDTDIKSNWLLPASIKPEDIEKDPGNGCGKYFYGITKDPCYYLAQSYIVTPTVSNGVAGLTGYYSWTAATAGAGDKNQTTPNQEIEDSSICPKGWKLPSGGTSSSTEESNWTDFYGLLKKMNLSVNPSLNWNGTSNDLAIVQNPPYNFHFTGYMDNGSIGYLRYSNGIWWTRTINSDTLADRLYIYTNGLIPLTNSYYRYLGFAIRCVAAN